jgi:hypothetical protein
MPRAFLVDGDELVRFPTPTAAKAAAQAILWGFVALTRRTNTL